ncbi:DUF3971 domain-containing protein [Kaistia dalseonensis]|uniref:DUF3971 domain-containing protein n=1 Tax=Kaistia dalseonensis TaxID=410840 RepID=A0ABU0H2E6_9HYPH|nr:DUF3971 domain-containing protein [Kaistia dalseonensis]MCX5493503.1 DUF3971 domain-containing protein [Kaistia dalseonensis]MDQ0436063.1 hypothetical protein [Kaistia dalseonensis]
MTLRMFGVVALFALVAFGALVMIVASGPIQLNALRDRVVAAMSERLGPGYVVRVGGASIDVDPVLGLIAQIDEITVRDSDRTVVARVPAIRLAIDPLSLARLRVDVRTIEVSEPEISLVRDRSGSIYLGTSETLRRPPAPIEAAATPSAPPADTKPVGPDGGFPDLLTALHTLDGGLEPLIELALERNFERLSIDAATIRVWDAARLQQRVFAHSDLAINVDPRTEALKASFNTSGYMGRWGLLAERTVDEQTRGRTLTLAFSQLTLADLNPNFGDPASLLSSDVPVFGRATVRFGEKGDVEDATMRIDLGAGNIISGFSRDTVLLDEATIRLHWDMAKRAVIIEPSSFFFGDTRGVVTGVVKPITDIADGRYSFSLESQNSILAARDANAPPIVADRIALAGTADFPGKRIDFTDAVLTSQAGSIAAAGTLGLEGPTPSLAMAASFTPMSISTFKQMWPPFLAGPARKWVMDHVTDGRIEAGRFEASIPGGVLWTGERVQMPEDYMRLDARLAGVSFTTVGTIPPIINASGNAVLAGSTFGIDMDGGQVITPSGKTVQVTAGAFAVGNTAQVIAEGQVELQLEGDIGALAEIGNADPIFALRDRSIDPADLSGKGRASLSIKIPMKPGLLPDDVDWRLSLITTDFASSAPIDGRMIKKGMFDIKADQDQLTINGKATINGVPASINLVQPLGDHDGDGETEAGSRKVSLSLDARARQQLGIGLDNVLGGTVGAAISDLPDGKKGQHYELDLKQARLTLPAVGWSKGIGVPAKLAFDLLQHDGGFSIDNMVASGDGFGLKGSAELDGKYGLVSADLEHLALRKGDDVSVKLARKGNGYAITARGSSFDVRGLIAQYKSGNTSSTDGAADLSIDAKIDTLIGFNQATLSGSSILVRTQSGTVQKATLDGILPQGGVSMNYSDTGNAAELSLTSADTGGLFRFVDLYRRIMGGDLSLTGKRDGPSSPFVGVFDVTQFAIVGEESMRRLVSATNGTGEGATPTGVNPDNVPFGRMRLDYTKRGPIIVIEDAVLRGASVGSTFSGTIDLAKQFVSLAGTYLPAYAFNNLFGRLPLIGLALGGGSKGGLFGVTFKVEGPATGPSLTVNPLSLITPGIFRKIFEFPVN